MQRIDSFHNSTKSLNVSGREREKPGGSARFRAERN